MDFFSFHFNTRNVDLFLEVVGDYEDNKLLTHGIGSSKLELIKSQGRYESDIIRLQDTFNFIISKDILTAFQRANLTGWDTYNIHAEGLKKEYLGFQVTGKCGEINRPSEGGFIIGHEFDIETWDKSDFFVPNKTLLIFMTEKARNIFIQFKIPNIEIRNIKEDKWYNPKV